MDSGGVESVRVPRAKRVRAAPRAKTGRELARAIAAIAPAGAEESVAGLFAAWLHALDRNDGDPTTRLREVLEDIDALEAFGATDEIDALSSLESGAVDRADHALLDVLERADVCAIRADLARRFPRTELVFLAHELLLEAGDARGRARRGVYTTPGPLVAFVVESVDRALREELGLADGLADRATWSEVAARGIADVPPGVDPGSAFVRVLDPATGTGPFLVEVLRRIHRTLAARWSAEGLAADESAARWTAYARESLARRLVGFELLSVPRSLARKNLAWALSELGGAPPAIEVIGANPLALRERIPSPCTVVLGNPPWSVRSGSLEASARELVEPYRSARGVPVVEKGALRLEMHLQDDYVKFVRLAELVLEGAGAGVVGLVTNSGFLDGLGLRGMRASLAASFASARILDLRGSRARRGERERDAEDASVFAIGQGTSVFVGVRRPKHALRDDARVGGDRARGGDLVGGPVHGAGEGSDVRHGELRGSREAKLAALETRTLRELADTPLHPEPPHWFFVPRRASRGPYATWIRVSDLFPASVSGIVTAHDHLVVAFDDRKPLEVDATPEDDVARCDDAGRELHPGDAALRAIASVLLDDALSDDAVRERLEVRDNAGWKLARARERLRADPELALHLRDYAYRPFDMRRILWHPALVWCDRRRLMQHLDGRRNVALVVCRQLAAPPWRHVFATRDLVDDNLVSNRTRERSHCFPLYVRASGESLVPNLEPELASRITPSFAERPEDVLAYVYAVLHAPSYRERFEDDLSVDFPRIPPAPDRVLFADLASIGRELLDAHCAPTAPTSPPQLRGAGPIRVERGFPRFAEERIELRAGLSLAPVDPDVWSFRVGSHAPAAKWLRDRVGRELAPADLRRYADVLARVRRTLDAMARLDALVPALLDAP